jgi:class 3 adenylate cyclase
VAARVADSAKGGEVLVTGDIRKSVGDLRDVTFSRLRNRSFKGLHESIAVCKATAA